MKKITNIFLISMAALLLSVSCDDNRYGDPPQPSVPVITSATIEPASFTYGDSVTITAAVSDPEITLSTLAVSLVLDNKTVPVTTLDLRTGETSANVSTKIFIPLVDNMPDNAPISFVLTLANTRNGTDTRELTGFTGNRPYFTQLYLVIDNGGVYPLTPQAGNRDNYAVTDVVLSRSFTYRIAQKITAGNQIDYSGLVWGDSNGKIQLIGETGGSLFAFANSDIATAFTFDNYRFEASQTGAAYATPNFMLDDFTETAINNEEFYTFATTLTKNQEYHVYNDLASRTVVYNVDFFERINANKVKFLGETGEYTLYYNPVRKHVIIGVASPSHPDYLLACGYGLGYPVKITTEELKAVYPSRNIVTTDWGFGNVQQFILLRKISENVYQATVSMPGAHDHYAGFGIYDNSGWANQQNASQYIITGEPVFPALTGNNFDIPNGDGDPVIPSDNYRLTINIAAKTLNVSKVTLP
ncbi:MAG: DUF5016 domain-containing protein [Prevotellaceae bacterium]|jgi:hypothetical protein|nr:DUF5016 domain-containing protein [Prevotellaceae bacterium]